MTESWENGKEAGEGKQRREQQRVHEELQQLKASQRESTPVSLPANDISRKPPVKWVGRYGLYGSGARIRIHRNRRQLRQQEALVAVSSAGTPVARHGRTVIGADRLPGRGVQSWDSRLARKLTAGSTGRADKSLPVGVLLPGQRVRYIQRKRLWQVRISCVVGDRRSITPIRPGNGVRRCDSEGIPSAAGRRATGDEGDCERQRIQEPKYIKGLSPPGVRVVRELPDGFQKRKAVTDDIRRFRGEDRG